MKKELERKEKRLISILKGYDTLLVAFSGGVDSTYLLAVAHDVMPAKVLAVTDQSPLHPEREISFAIQFARQLGVAHRLIESPIIDTQPFASNPVDRCYWCKKTIIEQLIDIGAEKNIRYIAHGANMDDLDDYRPGFKAAQEAGIVAPLLDAEMTKSDIRMASKSRGLITWNKPSMACLASRLPYGQPITEKGLKTIDRAETVLHAQGFHTCRVRHHGDVARIELDPNDIEQIMIPHIRESIVAQFRKLGFLHVSVDLEGYAQGRMNRSLE